jgi:hypothetical protein
MTRRCRAKTDVVSTIAFRDGACLYGFKSSDLDGDAFQLRPWRGSVEKENGFAFLNRLAFLDQNTANDPALEMLNDLVAPYGHDLAGSDHRALQRRDNRPRTEATEADGKRDKA